MVMPCKVVEVSATMLTMKGWVIFLIHLTTAVSLLFSKCFLLILHDCNCFTSNLSRVILHQKELVVDSAKNVDIVMEDAKWQKIS